MLFLLVPESNLMCRSRYKGLWPRLMHRGVYIIQQYVTSVNMAKHGLWTPREEIAFTARPKIQSQSQIFRYGRSIFCLPHRPNFSDIFDLCLHWVSVVRGHENTRVFIRNYSNPLSHYKHVLFIAINYTNVSRCIFNIIMD